MTNPSGIGSGTITVNSGILTVNYGSAGYTFSNTIAGTGTVSLTAANASTLTGAYFQPSDMTAFDGTITIDTGFNNIYYQLIPQSGMTFNGSTCNWVVNNQNSSSFVYTGQASRSSAWANRAAPALSRQAVLPVQRWKSDRSDEFDVQRRPGRQSFWRSPGTFQDWRGALTLTGSNSYTGGTALNNGTIRIGDGGASGSLGTGAVTNSGTLAFDRSDTGLIVSSAISGSGNVVQDGSGRTTFSNSNSYTGGTAIDAARSRSPLPTALAAAR